MYLLAKAKKRRKKKRNARAGKKKTRQRRARASAAAKASLALSPVLLARSAPTRQDVQDVKTAMHTRVVTRASYGP